jgi:hypothetical protein
MEKTFVIKVSGEELEYLEKLSAEKFRSSTKQIMKIIAEFVAKNTEPVESMEQ